MVPNHAPATPSVDESATPANDGRSFPPPGPPTASPAGYYLLGELGRGGMGVVHRARDVALGREVAIKVLADHYPPGSAGAVRFVEEARITGQLQHPGIPAVHQTGVLPDGRPFLVMKLIQGRTLDDLLKARGEPGTDHGRFLAIFEAVGQAVGYAHAHAVVHRDLKPQNVMVGAYGEVQVMDWGLAKVRNAECGMRNEDADPPPSPESALRTPHSALTVAGAVLGTPAYMPPEQAAGAVDRIDARSDVFGLGAILCVVLTGRPPYDAADAETTRLMAARGDLAPAFARLDGAGADPELVALCKRCLSAEKAARPKDAGEVAAAVAALRAAADDRARAAELDRRAAAVRAAEDRKRRRVVTAAAVVVAAVLAGGAGVSYWQARRAEEQAANAVREKERADAQYRQARLALVRILGELDAPGTGSIPQVIELRRAQSEHALAFFEGVGAGEEGADPRQRVDLAAACKDAARLQLALGRHAPAEANLRRAARILEELNVEAAADPEPRVTLAACYNLLGVVLGRDLPGRVDEAAACGRKAVAVGERLVADFPADIRMKFDLAQACDNLGTLYRSHPGGSVVELYERSLTLQRELHRDHPGRVEIAVGLAATCSNLGAVYWGNNRTDDAADVFQEGLGILEPLAAAHPGHVWYASTLASLRINLGGLWLTRGKPAEAAREYDRALAALKDVLRREPEHAQARADLLPAHGGRAQALGALGRHKEAVADWDRVVELAPAENRAGYRIERAAVLIRAGDRTRAAAEADDVAGAAAATAAHRYEAGRVHARLAAAAGGSPEAADAHAARAVAWLRKAHEGGFFKSRADAAKLNQFEFFAVRTRADFRQLVRDVTESLPGPDR